MAGVGRVGRATRRFVRDQANIAGIALITAELAVITADLVDAAKRDGKPREALAAARDLRELLAELSGGGGEPGPGAGGAAPGGVDGASSELESLLGSGPSLGDGTDS
jgi:hypothetical protein